MRKLAATFLLLVASAGPSSAQTLVVRSGEHGTFTRLTLRIPDGTGWQLDQNGREVRVVLDHDKAFDFDFSGVFARIGQQRLSEITHTPPDPALYLKLSCDCQVKGFVEDKTLLVFDIQEDAAAGNPRAALPITFNLPQYKAARVDAPTEPIKVQRREAATKNLTELLSLQLRRGVQQRLLQVASDDPLDGQLASGPDGSKMIMPSNLPASGTNMSAITSFDRDGPLAFGNHGTVLGGACIGDEVLKIQNWGSEQAAHEELGKLRRALYGEFDKASKTAILELARLYIFLGYGAEAQQVITLDRSVSAAHPELHALSQIIDDRQPSKPSFFSGQQGCPGAAALWAVLSEGIASNAPNSDATIEAFLVLPPHLRQHLGPRLAAAFASAGESDLSRIVLNTISRTGRPGTPSEQIIHAQLAEQSGNPEEAMRNLKAVLADEADAAEIPQALIMMIETSWQNRSELDPDTLLLVEALAQEHRNSEPGLRLKDAHILAQGLAGNFDNAFRSIKKPDRRAPESSELTGRLLTLLAENADDITFLTHALSHTGRRLARLDNATRSQLARRMYELGFPNQSKQFLFGPILKRAPSDQRMLRAEIALAQGFPHRALLSLEGLDSDAANQVRATVLSKSGDIGAAAKLLADLGATEKAAQLLWRSQDLRGLQQLPPTRFAEAAAFALELDAAPPASPPDRLSDIRAKLNASEVARDQVARMLQIFAAP